MEIHVETQGNVKKLPLNNVNLRLLDSCEAWVLDKDVVLTTQMFDRYPCRQLLHVKGNAFYIIVSNQLNILYLENFDSVFELLQSRGVLSGIVLDKETAHFHNVLYGWTLGSSILESTLLELEVPKQFQSVSSTWLYRGLKLRPSNVKALLQGKTVALKPRKCTSWTTSPNIAKYFCSYRSNTGCVIRCPAKQLPVFINIKKALGDLQVFDEREVIVLGNGIDTISSDNIYWRSWKTEEEIRQEDTNAYYVTKSLVTIQDSVYIDHKIVSINSLNLFKKYAACDMYCATHNRKISLKTGSGQDLRFSRFIVSSDTTLYELDDNCLITVRNLDSMLEKMIQYNVVSKYSADEAVAILLSNSWRIALNTSPAIQQYLKSLVIPQEYRVASFSPVYIKLNGLSDKAKSNLSAKKSFNLTNVTLAYKKKSDAVFEMKYSGEKYANNSAVISCDVTNEDIFLNPAVAYPKNMYCKNSVFIKPHKIENYALVAKNYKG